MNQDTDTKVMTFNIRSLRQTGCRLMAAAMLATLSACSMIPDVPVPGMDRVVGEDGMFRDRKGEYLDAESIPRTRIPESLDSYIIDDLLVIPELPRNTFTAFVDAPRPRPLEGSSEREVVIQRMDDRSWIVADAGPSQIWPRVRDYWRQKGVPIDAESPSEGVMETGWFALDGNVLNKEKFRVHIEPGFQDNSAEVRLSHVTAPQAAPNLTAPDFDAGTTDPELTYEFLREMSQYLADVANLYQASTVSFQARTLSSSGKASLVTTPSGNSLLRLRADYDRSWAALRRALARNNIEIVRENADLGLFDLAFDPRALEQARANSEAGEDGDDSPGLFRRLVTLNGMLGTEDAEGNYRIRLQLLPTGNVVEVLAVPFEDNSAASTEAVNTLMQLLRSTIA